jgi:hypothetical protein
VAAAMRASRRLFGGERNASALGNDGHVSGRCLPYHEPHENRKESTRILEA